MRGLAFVPLPGMVVAFPLPGTAVGAHAGPMGVHLAVEIDGGRDEVTTVTPGNPIPDGARFVAVAEVYGAPVGIYARPMP